MVTVTDSAEMKKNIALVINDLKGNGAERVVITLAEEFIRQGHRCTIICFKQLIELEVNNKVPVIFFPMNKYRWIPRSLRGKIVSKFLDKFILNKIGTPDLILSNLLPVDRILSHSQLDNVYLVIHNTMTKEYALNTESGKLIYKNELSRIYNRKPCICVSKGVMSDFNLCFPDNKNTCAIYNPIDLMSVKEASKKFKPIYENYIIHVGKFKSAKRHDVLLNAFAKSKTTKKLVLVGQGPLKEEMEALAEKLGVSDKVIFADFQENPYPYIKGASLLILSSDFEGLGMVLLEAQILGTPVISSDCPSGPREVLPERCLFPVNDPDAITRIFDENNFEQYRSAVKPEFESKIVCQQYLMLSNF